MRRELLDSGRGWGAAKRGMAVKEPRQLRQCSTHIDGVQLGPANLHYLQQSRDAGGSDQPSVDGVVVSGTTRTSVTRPPTILTTTARPLSHPINPFSLRQDNTTVALYRRQLCYRNNAPQRTHSPASSREIAADGGVAASCTALPQSRGDSYRAVDRHAR
mmetsp:Transcript_35262/g.62883  ORF Transcript_35262/g.62883 Transcript_35262/m.62883 type:complete len:160 (+) Transcript_35262:921-1400(+)